MKNILGTTENLELFTKDGKKGYKYVINSNGFSYEKTYDSNGNVLTYKDSNGLSRVSDIPEYTMKELSTKIGSKSVIEIQSLKEELKQELSTRLTNSLKQFSLTLQEAINIESFELKKIGFGSKSVIEIQSLKK